MCLSLGIISGCGIVTSRTPIQQRGVHIARCVAEDKIKEIRRLIGLIAPKKLVEEAEGDANPAGQPKKYSNE